MSKAWVDESKEGHVAMKDFDVNGDGIVDNAEMLAGLKSIRAPTDRERLTNDILNTSVMSALVGGFALGSLSPPGDKNLGKYVYICAYVAVHACTCSALTSAFLYAAVNGMADAAVAGWAAKNWPLLALPMMKFVVGTMCYMTSVILTSYRDLGGAESLEKWQKLALFIGVMSVAMVWGAFFWIRRSMAAAPKTAPAGP
ncbi:hypothetical protein JL721_2219 [Aureococcus anophagefferens]|nr:hypothetical protein JL721_2219 [Aureococcus anophagefferens]